MQLDHCPILCNLVFYNFILTYELFAKASRSLRICVLVNNNLCKILFSSLESPTTFDQGLSFFVLDFNLLGFKSDNFFFKILH